MAWSQCTVKERCGSWTCLAAGAGCLDSNGLHIQATEDESGLRILGCTKHELLLDLGLGDNWHRMARFLGVCGPKAERVEPVIMGF